MLNPKHACMPHQRKKACKSQTRVRTVNTERFTRWRLHGLRLYPLVMHELHHLLHHSGRSAA